MKYSSTLAVLTACVIGTITGIVGMPKLLNLQADQEQAESVAALLVARRALDVAEQELGYLPGEDWETRVASVVDPLQFQNPKKPKGQNGSGWGINLRTGLRDGITTPDPTPRHSADLPQDAILLMPWYESTISPNRNGRLPRPEGAPEEWKLPTSRHGKKAPVALVDGSIVLLTPYQLQQKLKLQNKPQSESAEQRINKLDEQLAQEMKTNKEGHTSFGGYLTLEEGVVTTPQIPSRGRPPIISFEAQSPVRQELDVQIIFLNEEGREINVLPDSQPIPLDKIMIIYNEWWFDDIKKKFEKPGANPHMGAAEKLANASYPAGTEIVEITNLRAQKRTLVAGEWIAVTLTAAELPTHTSAFQVQFKKAGESPLVIKNIKIGFK